MRDLDLLLSISNNILGKTPVRVRRRGGDARAVDGQDVPRRIRGAHSRGPLHRAGPVARLVARPRGSALGHALRHHPRAHRAAHDHRRHRSWPCRFRRPCSCTWSARWRRSSSSATGRIWSGPRGLLQPLADIVKLLFKEELRPKAADPILFYAAPVVCATAAFAAFAVVPFGADTTFFGLLDRPIHLAAADVNVGLLVIFAITSMGVYGIVLAGWSSNSKYSLLGGLRSSAQMISYELSYGLSFAAVIMLAGSLSLRRDRRAPGRATGSASFRSGTSSSSPWASSSS